MALRAGSLISHSVETSPRYEVHITVSLSHENPTSEPRTLIIPGRSTVNRPSYSFPFSASYSLPIHASRCSFQRRLLNTSLPQISRLRDAGSGLWPSRNSSPLVSRFGLRPMTRAQSVPPQLLISMTPRLLEVSHLPMKGSRREALSCAQREGAATSSKPTTTSSRFNKIPPVSGRFGNEQSPWPKAQSLYNEPSFLAIPRNRGAFKRVFLMAKLLSNLETAPGPIFCPTHGAAVGETQLQAVSGGRILQRKEAVMPTTSLRTRPQQPSLAGTTQPITIRRLLTSPDFSADRHRSPGARRCGRQATGVARLRESEAAALELGEHTGRGRRTRE